jgi:hypothetical protein
MVNTALSLGAVVGVLFSAGFVYWEVGRYAAPQVLESRFDERKEMISYTAGLFVGVPLAVLLLLLFSSIPPFEIGGIVLYMALLVGGTELAQWWVLRTAYFGQDGAGPFYAIGLRSGIGGILALALVAQYLSGPSISALGLAGPVCAGLAVVFLENVGAVLSLPATGDRPVRRGGPISGIPIAVVGFFFLGYAASFDPSIAIVGALVVAAGALWLYRSIAPPILSRVSPRLLRPPEDASRSPSTFGPTRR